MSAVEEIESAIKKLTALRDAAMPGPWTTTSYPNREASVVQGGPTNEWGDLPGYDLMEVPDADLIVTLHRTIDAQLALLRHTVELHQMSVAAGFEDGWLAAVERAGDLELARAINGTS